MPTPDQEPILDHADAGDPRNEVPASGTELPLVEGEEVTFDGTVDAPRRKSGKNFRRTLVTGAAALAALPFASRIGAEAYEAFAGPAPEAPSISKVERGTAKDRTQHAISEAIEQHKTD